MTENQTRKHLYLDIDGVLNGTRANYSEWGEHETVGWMIGYPKELIKEFNDIIATTENLHVYWLTSWEDMAASFAEDVGLIGGESWDWLPACGPGRGLRWEKFASLKAHLEEHKPDVAIWCEDELNTEGEARRWADQRGVLTLAPYNVLTPDHVEHIRKALA